MKTLLLLVIVGWASVAAAQDAADPRDVARQHYRAGEARFQAGDYRAAMVAFLAADAVAPSATLVYNVAVCHERLGEPADAARRYREYLSRRKDAPNRAEVTARITALEATRAPQTLPPEYPDGDGLSTPRSLGADPASPVAPSLAPMRRPYDEAFARRVPGPGQAEAPLAPGSPEPPVAATPAPQPAPYPYPYPDPVPASPDPAPRKEKPLYKQWWFWVFVGVGAVILVDVATSGGDDDGDRPTAARGLTLIKF